MLIPGLVDGGVSSNTAPKPQQTPPGSFGSVGERVRHNESPLFIVFSKLIVFFYQRCQFNGGQFNNLSTVDKAVINAINLTKISAATKSWCAPANWGGQCYAMKSADMPGQDSQYHLDLRLYHHNGRQFTSLYD